jgi:hypothetical protein
LKQAPFGADFFRPYAGEHTPKTGQTIQPMKLTPHFRARFVKKSYFDLAIKAPSESDTNYGIGGVQ